MLLSAFFGISRKRPGRSVADPRDRRAEDRYEAYHPVKVSIGPYSAVDGTVINLSLGGAAVLSAEWRTKAPADWLSRLARGDELRLAGLLDDLVTCRVVTVDAGVLRVQFARDDVLRGQLREMVDSLASP
jgi:PilZ domain